MALQTCVQLKISTQDELHVIDYIQGWACERGPSFRAFQI